MRYQRVFLPIFTCIYFCSTIGQACTCLGYSSEVYVRQAISYSKPPSTFGTTTQKRAVPKPGMCDHMTQVQRHYMITPVAEDVLKGVVLWHTHDRRRVARVRPWLCPKPIAQN
jgi:hypothetical protein